MDLKQMQYFLCLAQEGNATRAARQLNIVQPALSMQIAKIAAIKANVRMTRSTSPSSWTKNRMARNPPRMSHTKPN